MAPPPTLIYRVGNIWVSARSQQIFHPEIPWAFRSIYPFDCSMLVDEPDHYVSVCPGDWISPSEWDYVPETQSWEVRHVEEDQGWAHATIVKDSNVCETGWIPFDIMQRSYKNMQSGTYWSLELGMPCSGNMEQKVPHWRHHVSLAYTRSLKQTYMKEAQATGNKLVEKFCRDGALPHYIDHCRWAQDLKTGRWTLSSIAHYRSAIISARGRSCCNAFTQMLQGRVVQQLSTPLLELDAEFETVRPGHGGWLIGDLDDACGVYNVASALQNFIKYQVLHHEFVSTKPLDIQTEYFPKLHVTLRKPFSADVDVPQSHSWLTDGP